MTVPGAVRVPWGRGEVHLLGTVPGLEEEAPRVAAFLDAVRPGLVALGVSKDELEGLRLFRAHPPRDDADEEEGEGDGAHPPWEEAEYDMGYAAGLHAHGTLSLPPPDLLAALDWAEAHQAEVVALDLSQEEYDRAWSENVGMWEFFVYGRRTRRMGKRPPKAANAREFVIAWDRTLRKGKGIACVEEIRERRMARRLRRLAEEGARVAALVPAPREEGVLAALRTLPDRKADAPAE